MNEISWPACYIPGFSDNFASNEIIVAGLSVAEIWPYLNNTNAWPTYYSNAADIRFHNGSGPELSKGAKFRFTTFGLPVEAEVVEYEPSTGGTPARLAWRGRIDGDAEHRLDAHHAWLLEDLADGRVRILTQETQNGKPARDLAATLPNPMINAHQEWITQMARSASRKAPY